MFTLLLLGFSWQPGSDVLPDTGLPHPFAEMTVDATKTNARGLQIVTIRLKIQPKYYIIGSSDHPPFKLVVTTRDPGTQVQVIYPQRRKIDSKVDSRVYYEDEVAIQVLIQRADGDQSPVQGRLDFTRFAVRGSIDVIVKTSTGSVSRSVYYLH